jgi:L-iditol 2-dehydrogenase/L-idonate 5-dehydrogenase
MNTEKLLTEEIVIHAAGDLRLERRPLESPRDDEAIVRIAFGGICGSDLHYWQHGAAGASVLKDPMVLGHEVVGTVLSAAADGSGPPAGTQVAVHPAGDLGSDHTYPEGRPNLSRSGTYLGSAARHPHTDGAFGTLAVLPAAMLRPLPPGLSLRGAALAEPASVAWHAVERAGDVRGKRVLVVGCGPIGGLAIAVLRRFGAGEIIAVDLHEEALERARALGATSTLVASDQGAVEAVQADIAMESSGSPHGLAAAIAATRPGGRVVMVGLLPNGRQPVPIATAIARELELVGSFRFTGEMSSVLDALADGSLAVDPLVTHVFPLGRTQEAFETARDPKASGKVLIDFTANE